MKKSTRILRRIVSDFYMVIILIFLYAPILTMMVLSFNASKSRTQWGGFTLEWYAQMFDSRSIMSALSTTLTVAFASALIATIIGTAAAIAIQRMRPGPRTFVMGVTNIPMLNADIVTGISLMLSFIAFGIPWALRQCSFPHHLQYPLRDIERDAQAQADRPVHLRGRPGSGGFPLQAFFKVTSRTSCRGALRLPSGLHHVPG